MLFLCFFFSLGLADRDLHNLLRLFRFHDALNAVILANLRLILGLLEDLLLCQDLLLLLLLLAAPHLVIVIDVAALALSFGVDGLLAGMGTVCCQ